MKKVGIDISKRCFDVAFSTAGSYQYFKFTNDVKGFKSLLKIIEKEDHCIMEASGPYYIQLATFLHENGIKVSVINPLVIRRFSQMRLLRAKTDKADAALIAEYGKTQDAASWSPDPTYILQLRQMQALLNQYIKQRSALSRQQEAFTVSGVKNAVAEKSLKKAFTTLEKEIEFIEAQMQALIEQHHKQMMKQLQSIPGIGKKASLLLIVVTGGFKKFKTSKQISSYIGLSPRIYESGTSVKGKAKICKMGMSKVRAMLYMCSMTAKSCNKACRELFNRLVEKGKAKKLALIAVANKLIKQAFALATKNEFYLEK